MVQTYLKEVSFFTSPYYFLKCIFLLNHMSTSTFPHLRCEHAVGILFSEMFTSRVSGVLKYTLALPIISTRNRHLNIIYQQVPSILSENSSCLHREGHCPESGFV